MEDDNERQRLKFLHDVTNTTLAARMRGVGGEGVGSNRVGNWGEQGECGRRNWDRKGRNVG